MSSREPNHRKFLVLQGDWFDYQFAEFTLGQQKDYIEVREFLTTPKYRVSHTGESYRAINNWDENGLLFENETRETGWRQFSLTELLWIHCVRELRKFGFSITALKVLRDNLFIFNGLKRKHFSQLELAFFITKIIQKQDVILIADTRGIGNFCLVADYEKSQIIKPLPASYVVVNLNMLYGEITKQSKYTKKNTPLFVLSDTEQELLGKIIFDDVVEVKIKTKESKIQKVEYKKNKQNPDNVFEEIRKRIKDGKRRRISLELQDGKIIAMEDTEKT